MSVRSTIGILAATGLITASPAGMAQVDTGYQNREEQEIFGTSPNGDSGAILDAANPMDLINRIRQSGAMDDATPPSDAIDAALKAYQQNSD